MHLLFCISADDALVGVCSDVASTLFPQPGHPTPVSHPSLGFFTSHIDALKHLQDIASQIEAKDTISAERKAALYFWQDNTQAALDTLTSHSCLGKQLLAESMNRGDSRQREYAPCFVVDNMLHDYQHRMAEELSSQ